MNKLALILSASATTLALAAGAGQLLNDYQIDRAVEHLQLHSPANVDIAIAADENHWNQRQITLAVTITEAEQQLALTLENRIKKRPWGARIEHSLHLSRDTVELIEFPALQTLLQQNLVDQAFLSGHTRLSPTGRFDTQASSVAVNQQLDVVSVQIHPILLNSWGRFAGQVNTTGQWQGASLHIEELEEVSVTLMPMSFSMAGQAYGGLLFAGEQRLSGEGFSVALNSAWQQSGFTLGNYELVSTGEVDNNRFNGALRTEIESLNLYENDDTLGLQQLVLAMSVAGIEAENYQQLITALNRMQLGGGYDQDVKAATNQFLRNGFEIAIDELSASIADEKLNFSAKLRVPENSIADVNNPFSLLGLLTRFSAASQLRFAMVLEEEPQLAEAVMALMMTGALIVDGDDYALDFSLQNGQALVNGQALKIPF